MPRKVPMLVFAGCLLCCVPGRADFKYTQTAQMTGGAMVGMMKGLSIFSKSMRQAMKPMETTTYVKGNYLRRDNADGSYQIIDLGGKRFINVYPDKKSYGVMTFDQMRQMMATMQQRMSEAMKNRQNANPQDTNVKITPKITVTPTGKTQTILGQDTQEVDVKMDMEMQATNPQQGAQSATLSTEVDTWVAPSIIGYHEVSDFYRKMATEIGWTPNTTFGMDPRVKQSMVELTKSGKMPTGLPLLTTMNIGQQASQPQQQQTSNSSGSSGSLSDVTSPSAVAAKALGGMFGGFGRRKKKQQQEDQQSGSAAQPSAPPNALMSMTTRVESYSTDSLDASLFQIPAGFTQIPQPNMNQMMMQRTAH
jgi:hypothetical protein